MAPIANATKRSSGSDGLTINRTNANTTMSAAPVRRHRPETKGARMMNDAAIWPRPRGWSNPLVTPAWRTAFRATSSKPLRWSQPVASASSTAVSAFPTTMYPRSRYRRSRNAGTNTATATMPIVICAVPVSSRSAPGDCRSMSATMLRWTPVTTSVAQRVTASNARAVVP